MEIQAILFYHVLDLTENLNYAAQLKDSNPVRTLQQGAATIVLAAIDPSSRSNCASSIICLLLLTSTHRQVSRIPSEVQRQGCQRIRYQRGERAEIVEAGREACRSGIFPVGRWIRLALHYSRYPPRLLRSRPEYSSSEDFWHIENNH